MRTVLKCVVLVMLVWPLVGFHGDTAQFNVECGDEALSRGFSEQALRYWGHALELDAAYAPAYLSRGFFYLKSGRTDAAVADFSRLIEHHPKEAGYYLTRGLTLIQSGAKEQGMADFRAGCDLGDQSACAFLAEEK